MRTSIRTKLIVAILLPLLAVYLGVLAINYTTGKRQAQAQAEQHLKELASNHATRLDGRFRAAEQAAAAVATLIADRQTLTPPRQSSFYLARRVSGDPLLFGAVVAIEPGVAGNANHAGQYFYRVETEPAAPAPGRGGRKPGQPASRPAKGPAARFRKAPPFRRGDLAKDHPTFFEEDWYAFARTTGQPAWSEPRLVKTAGQTPICRYTVPLMREEQFVGVVAFDISVKRFCQYVDSTKLEGGHCMLVSHAGLLVAHPSKRYQMKQNLYALAESNDEPALSDLADDMANGIRGIRKLPGQDGQTDWVVFSPVESPGWSFAAVIPESRIMDPVSQRLRSNMSIMLGGLGVIMAMVLLVSIRMTRPISTLAAVVRHVADGDLDVRAEGIDSQDEIGELAGAFNTMVSDLKRHIAALTDETAARQAVESELRFARDIQTSLLPQAFPPYPDRGEFDLHAMVVPAKQVAGDFFDFFFVDDDTLALVIADVSGKGAPAAIFMAMTRTVLRAQAISGKAPKDVLTRANHIIASDNDRAMFVTLFFAHYNTRTGELVYANAGHNPPCIGGRGDVHRLAESTGPILGVFADQQYTQRTVQLDHGASLVLYTDGVTEALDAADRQFSLDRFERIIAQNPTANPEEITNLVVQTVEQYRTHAQQDDVTLMALRRN